MRRQLGRTEIEISAIGLGCWQFSEGRGIVGGYWPALPPDTVADIVRVSHEAGVNWYDTAEAYGDGKSEIALSRALQANHLAVGSVVVATKWLPRPPRTARSIGKTIGERLNCLSPFPIDLYQIHQPVGSLSSHGAQMKEMEKLVKAGKIGSVGISNFGAKAMRACHSALAARGIPLASNQVEYSLLKRDIESDGTLVAAKELGITIIAYSPLAQGIATGRFHADAGEVGKIHGVRRLRPAFWKGALERSRPLINVLRDVAAAHGATPAQVALAWLTQFHGETVVAIPGATKVSQAASNAASMALTLSAAELGGIDAASRRFL